MTTPRQNRTKPKRKSHAISGAIEAAIRRNELKPGDRLPSEEELGQRHNASRTVVREAIQQLTARGILQTFKGSGSYVASHDGSHIRKSLEIYSALARNDQAFLELMDLRILIETECTRRLATQRAAELLAAVEARLAAMIAHKDDLVRYGEADIAFHLEIVRAADNSLYADIMGALLPDLGVRFAHETYTGKSLVAKTLRDHRAIYAALAAGAANLAAAAMNAHLIDSRNHFTRMRALQAADAVKHRNSGHAIINAPIQ